MGLFEFTLGQFSRKVNLYTLLDNLSEMQKKINLIPDPVFLQDKIEISVQMLVDNRDLVLANNLQQIQYSHIADFLNSYLELHPSLASTGNSGDSITLATLYDFAFQIYSRLHQINELEQNISDVLVPIQKFERVLTKYVGYVFVQIENVEVDAGGKQAELDIFFINSQKMHQFYSQKDNEEPNELGGIQ